MKKKIKIIAAVAATTGAVIHIINRIQFSIADKKNILERVESKYYDWRFGKIHYTVKGNGKPLLLVHNLTVGSCGYEFYKIADQLSAQFEVYTMDLLGYGLSDKPDMTYTSFLYVQLLSDFIKNVIGRKSDIVTSGDSSSISIMTCHNNPEVCNKLIFINPQSLHQLSLIPTRRSRTLKFLIDLPVIGTFIFNLVTSRLSFLSLFQKYYYTDITRLKETDLQAYREASHKYDYHAKYSFSSHIGRYMNFNILHALKEINHSIFIIAGNNKTDNKSIIENYFSYNSSIEVTYISETKQYPHMEAPAKVLDQLEIFL